MENSLSTTHDAVLNDFKITLQNCTRRARCGREYVLVAGLIRWMNSKRPGKEVSQAACLLKAAYSQANATV